MSCAIAELQAALRGRRSWSKVEGPAWSRTSKMSWRPCRHLAAPGQVSRHRPYTWHCNIGNICITFWISACKQALVHGHN